MADQRKNGNKRRNSEGKPIITPGPVPGMPVTQPSRDRPSLGSGAAEQAARSVESRRDVITRRVDRATGRGNGDRKKDD